MAYFPLFLAALIMVAGYMFQTTSWAEAGPAFWDRLTIEVTKHGELRAGGVPLYWLDMAF